MYFWIPPTALAASVCQNYFLVSFLLVLLADTGNQAHLCRHFTVFLVSYCSCSTSLSSPEVSIWHLCLPDKPSILLWYNNTTERTRRMTSARMTCSNNSNKNVAQKLSFNSSTHVNVTHCLVINNVLMPAQLEAKIATKSNLRVSIFSNFPGVACL